jgi:putative glycosyltransferase (TIGR04372 family)
MGGQIPKKVKRDMVSLGYLFMFRTQFLGITKHHYSVTENRELLLREIFKYDIGFFVRTSDYVAKGIKLIEKTPDEIRDVAIEMVERLNGTWQPGKIDEVLQRRFREIFRTDALDEDQGRPLHGEVHSRFGAHFLRNNRDWLQ